MTPYEKLFVENYNKLRAYVIVYGHASQLKSMMLSFRDGRVIRERSSIMVRTMDLDGSNLAIVF